MVIKFSIILKSWVFFHVGFFVFIIIIIYIQAIVSEEDGMDSIAHRFLSAAIKVHFYNSYYLSLF